MRSLRRKFQFTTINPISLQLFVHIQRHYSLTQEEVHSAKEELLFKSWFALDTQQRDELKAALRVNQ